MNAKQNTYFYATEFRWGRGDERFTFVYKFLFSDQRQRWIRQGKKTAGDDGYRQAVDANDPVVLDAINRQCVLRDI